MKILHLIPLLTGNGSERQLAYLTRELMRRSHDVRIAYTGEGPAPWQAQGLHALQLPPHRHRDPRFLAAVVALIRSWRPHVVQTWYMESDLVGGVAAALARTPWLLREPSSTPFYEGRLKARLRVAIARLSAGAIVANSAEGMEYWERHARPLMRRLIGNAVPVEEIDAAPSAALDGERVVVYAGRLLAMKNVDVLIAAAAQLMRDRSLKLVICGSGPDHARLQDLANKLGIAEHVLFAGYARDVWGHVKAADLFVSLSDFEGMPNAVLEAFAAGTPAVLSDIAAHRAIAGDQSAFFAPLRDAGATAAAMHRALDDRAEAVARARNARRRVETFSIATTADAYEEVYAHLARR